MGAGVTVEGGCTRAENELEMSYVATLSSYTHSHKHAYNDMQRTLS